MANLAIFIVALISTLAAIITIFIVWNKSWLEYPLQASVRSLMGILVLLIGNIGVASITGDGTLAIDLPPAFQFSTSNLVFGLDRGLWITSLLLVCCLLTICLLQLPPTVKPPKSKQ